MIFTERFNLEKEEVEKILRPKPNDNSSDVQEKLPTEKDLSEKKVDKKLNTENS